MSTPSNPRRWEYYPHRRSESLEGITHAALQVRNNKIWSSNTVDNFVLSQSTRIVNSTNR